MKLQKICFFSKTGKFAVQKETGFEGRLQVVALLSSGAIIGEGALVEQKVRTTTDLAVESSEVFVLETEFLGSLIEKNPTTFSRLLKYCLHISSIRLCESTKRVAHIL